MEDRITILTDGQTTFNTKKYNGLLDSIIIDSEDKVEILIESELGYVVFNRTEFQGTDYFAIRKRTTAKDEKLQDSPDFVKFFLNESLNITVIGPKDSEVNLILRFQKS